MDFKWLLWLVWFGLGPLIQRSSNGISHFSGPLAQPPFTKQLELQTAWMKGCSAQSWHHTSCNLNTTDMWNSAESDFGLTRGPNDNHNGPRTSPHPKWILDFDPGLAAATQRVPAASKEDFCPQAIPKVHNSNCEATIALITGYATSPSL